jgi:hypothetical protein
MRLTPDQVISRQEALKSERGIWETHWQELYDYIVPRKANITRTVIPGEKRGVTLYDNTAMVSCETLVAALHGMLTNPNTLWFMLQTGNEELNNMDQVVQYLQEFSRSVHRVLNNSNFQPEVYEYYLDLATVGTATMTVEEDEDSDKIVRFSTKSIAEIYVAENAYGMIEECYRCFKWTAHQIVEEFAKGIDLANERQLEEVVGQKVVAAYKKNTTEKFEVIHCVYKEQLTTRSDMPFLSLYVLKASKKLVKEGRYRRFPYIISRWSKTSGEVYGRSPGMTALPEAKTLNIMSKTTLKGAQKVVDPPIQLPDDGFVRPFNTQPGGINYYRAGSNDRAMPIFNDSRIDFGYEAMRERQQRVRESFFVDKLNLTNNDRMTTVEVNQRVQEQLRFLGPLLGRQQTEFLRPLLDRVIDIVVRRDGGTGVLIGEPPPEIQNVELDVLYSSPIARAQRMSESEALQGALQASAPIITYDPNAMDNIDSDKWIRENFAIYGAPIKVLRSRQEIETIREARQQAQEQALKQQQEMENSEKVNNIAPAIGKGQ